MSFSAFQDDRLSTPLDDEEPLKVAPECRAGRHEVIKFDSCIFTSSDVREENDEGGTHAELNKAAFFQKYFQQGSGERC